MTHRKDDGFDLDAALEGLIEKYGQEDVVKKTPSKKRKDDGVVDLTGDEDVASNKKVKKTATVANEFNRPVAEAITELAGLYFKNKDTRKGGTPVVLKLNFIFRSYFNSLIYCRSLCQSR
jgi:hypothetical protein